MNCLILDDEPLAQKILEDYIKNIPYLSLQGKCSSAFEAYDILRTTKVDLIFLDIQMPNVSGIDFINSLSVKPMFIISTAFSEYALDGFNLNAIDYLLKPIPFDRFLKAVNKAHEYHLLTTKTHVPEQPQSNTPAPLPDLEPKLPPFLLVKADYQTIKIEYSNITYIEGLKDYVKIFVNKEPKPIITHLNIKMIGDKLPADQFVRVHKSYIVSIPKINSVTKNRIVIGEKWIPVGENYKDSFFNKFNPTQ